MNLKDYLNRIIFKALYFKYLRKYLFSDKLYEPDYQLYNYSCFDK